VADGFFHAFSGWVVYIVAFLLLFAVGWILDRVPGLKAGSLESKEKSERTFATQSLPPTTRVAKSEAND
jgi:hypothetical protein